MASDYGKEYHRKAESLLSDFLVGLPGMPSEIQDKTSPQFEVALSFSIGHALHSTNLDIEPERVSAQVEGVIEKMVLHGHVRSAEKMGEALNILGGGDGGAGWLKEHYLTMSMLLGIAQAPTATGAHFNKFEKHMFNASMQESTDVIATLEDDTLREESDTKTQEDKDDETLKAIMTASLNEWGNDLEASDSDDGLWFDDDDEEEVEGDKSDNEQGINRREEKKIKKALEAIDANNHENMDDDKDRGVYTSNPPNKDGNMSIFAIYNKEKDEKTHSFQNRKFRSSKFDPNFESESEEDETDDEDSLDGSNLAGNETLLMTNLHQMNTGNNTRSSQEAEAAALKRRLLAKKFGPKQEAYSATVVSGSGMRSNGTKRSTEFPKERNSINVNIDLNSAFLHHRSSTNSEKKHSIDQKQRLPHSEEVLQMNGLRSVLMSEAEAVRSCIHVLLGIPGPLFYFHQGTTTANSNDANNGSEEHANDDLGSIDADTAKAATSRSFRNNGGNPPPVFWGVSLSKWIGSGNNVGVGNGFRFDHLSSKSLTVCLKKFAEHASDLRFLREVIISNGQSLGRVWSAWQSVVVEWMSECDKQLSELDKMAYSLMKDKNEKESTNVTATLIRLSHVLKPSAKCASQLRQLCHKLNPHTMNASPGFIPLPTPSISNQSQHMGSKSSINKESTASKMMSTTAQPGDIILRNVLFSNRIVDGLWDSLQMAEICSSRIPPKSSISADNDSSLPSHFSMMSMFPNHVKTSSADPKLLKPPPLVESDWLRNALCCVLTPMIQTWSSWVLEGTLEDPCRESFLSLHVDSLLDQHGSEVGKETSSFLLGGASTGVMSGRKENKFHHTFSNHETSLVKQVPKLFGPCAALILSSGHAVRLMRAAANRREEHSPNTLLRFNRNRGKVVNDDDGSDSDEKEEDEDDDDCEGERSAGYLSCWTDSLQWIEKKLLKELMIEKEAKRECISRSQHQESSYIHEDGNIYSLVDLFQSCCSTSSSRFSLNHGDHFDNEKDQDGLEETVGENPVFDTVITNDDDYDPVLEEEAAHENDEDVVVDEEDEEEEEDDDDDDDDDEMWGGEWEESRASFAACEQFQDIQHFTERKVATPFLPTLYSESPEISSLLLEKNKNKISPSKTSAFATVTGLWKTKKKNLSNQSNSRHNSLSFSNTADCLHNQFIVPLMLHCTQANQASAQELLKSGGQGKDLISAFQVLRSIFLGADGLLLNQWRDKLFDISSRFDFEAIQNQNKEEARGRNDGGVRNQNHISSSFDSLFDPSPWMGLRDPLNMDASALSELFRSSVLDAVAVSRGGVFNQTSQKKPFAKIHKSKSQRGNFADDLSSKKYAKEKDADLFLVYDKFDQTQFNKEMIGGSLPLWFIEGGGVLSLDDFRVELMPAASASTKARKRDVHLRKHVSTFYSSSSTTSASSSFASRSPLKAHIMDSINSNTEEESILNNIVDGEGSILLPAPLFLPSFFNNINNDTYLKKSRIYSPGSGGNSISGMFSSASHSQTGGISGNDLAWADGIRQFGWLRLNCNIGWPLNAVVTSKSLNGYNKVWMLLQQVRYAHSGVESFRWLLHKQRKTHGLHHANNLSSNSTNMQDGEESLVDWHKITVQLGLIVHVISSLQGYLCNHSAVEHWPTLISDMESAQSVEELKQSHDVYLLKILERCILLPRAAKVLEYVLKVISGALRYATLGTALRSIDNQRDVLKQKNLVAKETVAQSQTPQNQEQSASLSSSTVIIAAMLEECYDNFLNDLKFVNAVGERLVVTRLAPYLEDVLLILDYNAYFENNLNH